MNSRTPDEKKCLIPESRTMNAAQYAADGRGEASTSPNTDITPFIPLSPPSRALSTIPLTTPETQPVSSKTPEERSTSRTDILPSDVPKQLWDVFLTKVAPIFPSLVIETDKLSTTFAVAVNHGQVGYKTIDPILGLCLAIGSLVSRNPQLWNSPKWYEKACENLNVGVEDKQSIEYFQARFLQVKYLQMSGKLRDAWITLCASIAEAGFLGLDIESTEQLTFDKNFQRRVQVIRQSLWMMRPFLALQLGYTREPLKAVYDPKLPPLSWIETELQLFVRSSVRVKAMSAFFFARISIAGFIASLVKLETTLRLTEPACPFDLAIRLPVDQLMEFDTSLHEWNHGLPKELEWTGLGPKSLSQPDRHVRRMRVLTHLGYLDLQLRLYRCWLILNMRLLCDCGEHKAHISRQNMTQDNRFGAFDSICSYAVRCVNTAHSVIETLWKPSGNGKDDNLGDMASTERVDIIYTAALVLIAGRALPCFAQDDTLGVASHAPDTTKSVTVLTDQLRKADIMLRNCEEACTQCPEFRERIQRSRAFVALVSSKSTPFIETGFPRIVCDGMLSIGRSVWVKLYWRLRVRLPLDDSADQITGHDLLFCWLETLPIDFAR